MLSVVQHFWCKMRQWCDCLGRHHRRANYQARRRHVPGGGPIGGAGLSPARLREQDPSRRLRLVVNNTQFDENNIRFRDRGRPASADR
jgi:hypothetical protein